MVSRDTLRNCFTQRATARDHRTLVVQASHREFRSESSVPFDTPAPAQMRYGHMKLHRKFTLQTKSVTIVSAGGMT